MDPFEKIPMWLELSGLPTAMNKAARSPSAWPVFCKIVMLDCRRNASRPSHVAISLRDLATACGIEPGAAQKCALSLRKQGWIACFVPDNEEEEALFQVKAPLPTPIPADQVRQAHPGLFPDAQAVFRYEKLTEADKAEEESEAHDLVIKEVVDLYFNSISMKMNNVILDEIRLICRRFDIGLIRKIVRRAGKHGINSIAWVVRELHRDTAKQLAKDAAKPDPPPDGQDADS